MFYLYSPCVRRVIWVGHVLAMQVNAVQAMLYAAAFDDSCDDAVDSKTLSVHDLQVANKGNHLHY